MKETKKITTEEFEILMDEVMDHFNFERIQGVMTFLDWKWSKNIDPPVMYAPSISDLKATARRLLREAFKLEGTIESGGFQARYIAPTAGDDDPENIPYLRLGFLAEWSETVC